MYNPYNSIEEYKKICPTYFKNKEYTIYMSPNNICISIVDFYRIEVMKQFCKFFIVRIDELNYIIEPTTMIGKYISMMPIYNLNGSIINGNLFTKVPSRINIYKILNFRMQYDTYITDFNILFDVMNNIETIVISDKKIFDSYSLMFIFMGLGLLNMTKFKEHIVAVYTSIIYDDTIYDKNHELYKAYIKSYYDHIHEKYNLDIMNLKTNNTNTLREKRIKCYDMISYWDKHDDNDYIYLFVTEDDPTDSRKAGFKRNQGPGLYYNIDYIEY